MAIEEPQPRRFGRFQVVEELGAGAMGIVYLCVDPHLARPVAIKVLREPDGLRRGERSRRHARFQQEAQAAGRLSHPDIVQIYDVGESYIVMEFVDGETLAALLNRGGRMPVTRACGIVTRVAEAIDYAHRNGVVHRDLKPANIMLQGDRGVKVMDFGVARIDSSTLTLAGTVVGSVRYMSPEQMMGQPVDGRSDVFSLAVVAYVLLTGRPPYPARSAPEVVAQAIHGAHIAPHRLDERYPEALDPVFARALSPKPESRHQHAAELARQLAAAARPISHLEISHSVHELDDSLDEPPCAVLVSPPAQAAADSTATFPGSRAGLVFIDSEPQGARASLDGRLVGATPVAGVEAGWGRHLVRLEMDGRESVSIETELGERQPLQAVSAALPLVPLRGSTLTSGALVDFGPDVTPLRRLAGSPPDYPVAARERGIEGTSTVEIVISPAGEVRNTRVAETAGEILDSALLAAVRKWRFSPPTLRGTPVSLRMRVTHVFRL
jgi:TonB family protein